MLFNCHAIDSNGNKKNDVIEALDKEDAVKKLQEQGMVVISVDKTTLSVRKDRKNTVTTAMLILIVTLVSFDIVVRLRNTKSGNEVFVKTSEDKPNNLMDTLKLEVSNRIDKQKFEKTYRAAKTLTAATEGGISYQMLQELNQNLLTEISIVEDSVNAGEEKELLGLYKSAYEAYKISESVWNLIIKHNLDNYAEQYPDVAARIFVKLAPFIEQFGLTVISKQSKYSGSMQELHKSELSKIWSVGQ